MPITKVDPRRRDRAIADLFRWQHGVAARAQLVEAGLCASTLDSRVARGRLVRIHREVYAEGHAPLSRRGQMRAALLAAGPGAVLSGESALELLRVRPPGTGPVHVSVTRRARSEPGVHIHQTRSLQPADVTTRSGMQAMTAARAIFDVALRTDEHRLGRDFHEACFRRALDARRMEATFERLKTSNAAPRVRVAWERYEAGSAGTWSELERAFVSLLIEHGIPVPALNVSVGLPGGLEIRVDGMWAEHGFVHEVDGAGHLRPRTHGDDRSRRTLLGSIGLEVVRIDAFDIQFDRASTADVIRNAMRRTLAR